MMSDLIENEKRSQVDNEKMENSTYDLLYQASSLVPVSAWNYMKEMGPETVQE